MTHLCPEMNASIVSEYFMSFWAFRYFYLLYKLQCVIGILATEKCRTCIRTHVFKHILEYSPFEIIELNVYNK